MEPAERSSSPSPTAPPVGEIAARLPVSRPAVSQHLKVLKASGLVSEEATAPATSFASTRPA